MHRERSCQDLTAHARRLQVPTLVLRARHEPTGLPWLSVGWAGRPPDGWRINSTPAHGKAPHSLECGRSALMLGVQQREGILDAPLEDLVGELSVGQGAAETASA
jgi:hypothetical protein